MKCTTGLSAHQFAELTQWISQSKPLHTIPAILGVAGSLQATLIYLRHNLPQAAIGELLGVSQPTVSRAVKALTVNRPGFDGGSDDTEGSLSWDRRSTPMSCASEPRG